MNLRKIATPLTMGAFVLMAVTGVLMFFHKDIGLNKEAHEWFSWAFVAGVALHVFVNFNAFARYFKMAPALGVIGVFVAVLGASFFLKAEEGGGSPAGLVMRSASSAPLADLAPLTGKSADELVAELKAGGFATADAAQSIDQIAQGDRAASGKMLKIVFDEGGAAETPR